MILSRELKNVGCSVLLACSLATLTGITLNKVSIVYFSVVKQVYMPMKMNSLLKKIHKGYSKF